MLLLLQLLFLKARLQLPAFIEHHYGQDGSICTKTTTATATAIAAVAVAHQEAVLLLLPLPLCSCPKPEAVLLQGFCSIRGLWLLLLLLWLHTHP